MAEKAATPRSAPNRHRTNLTLRMSNDEGVTWPVRKVLDPDIAGSFDIAVTPDGRIHVLYEGGTNPGWNDSHIKNRAMVVLSFDLAWLTDGQDRLEAGDQPVGSVVGR